MSDRELLEMAANAAGLYTKHEILGGDPMPFAVCTNRFSQDFREWNPLTDDGDSLRLAVRLGLNIDVYRKTPCGQRPGVEVRAFVHRRSVALEQAMDNDESLQVATRRAIVCAAAAIGMLIP